MSERTSNKQILEAINALTAAITANVAAPVAAVAAPTAPSGEQEVSVDKAYAEHMVLTKCQPFADKNAEDVVLYARKNGRGETKLAYCLASKFATIKDRGLLGAIEVVSPS